MAFLFLSGILLTELFFITICFFITSCLYHPIIFLLLSITDLIQKRNYDLYCDIFEIPREEQNNFLRLKLRYLRKEISRLCILRFIAIVTAIILLALTLRIAGELYKTFSTNLFQAASGILFLLLFIALFKVKYNNNSFLNKFFETYIGDASNDITIMNKIYTRDKRLLGKIRKNEDISRLDYYMWS